MGENETCEGWGMQEKEIHEGMREEETREGMPRVVRQDGMKRMEAEVLLELPVWKEKSDAWYPGL